MNLKAIDAAIAAYRTNLDEGDVSRLAFFRELWGVQAEAASHVDLGYEVPDADSLKTWARHGEPVLSHAPVKIEAAALAGAMERLAEVLAARGGFAASTSEALSRTSWERMVAASDLVLAGCNPAAYVESFVELLEDDGMDEDAARIGAMARPLLGEEVADAKLHLYGSFAETGKGHVTERALVAGLLGMKPDDLRIPNAFEEAKKAGLRYTIDEIDLRDAHPNTAVLELTGKGGRALTVQASSLGGGRIMVNKLDGIEVNFTGESNTLVVRNQDEFGSVAAGTSILNQLRVNVANMSVHRHKRGGDALMVIETDQHIKPKQVEFISELPGILGVTYYDKEDDEDGSGFDERNL